MKNGDGYWKKKRDESFASYLKYCWEEESKRHLTKNELGSAYILGRDWKSKTPRDKISFHNKRSQAKELLLSKLPDTPKYKALRKMLDLLIENIRVKNWRLVQCIKPKLTKKDYSHKKKTWDKRIKNRERTLRKILKPLGYTVSFKSEGSRLIGPKLEK